MNQIQWQEVVRVELFEGLTGQGVRKGRGMVIGKVEVLEVKRVLNVIPQGTSRVCFPGPLFGRYII